MPKIGGQLGGSFPPPPWEIHGGDSPNLSPSHHPNQHQQMEYTQVVITHSRPSLAQSSVDSTAMGNSYIQPLTTGVISAINNQTMANTPHNQFQPQSMPQPGQMLYGSYPQQMYGGGGGNQMIDYGYGCGFGQQQQHQNAQFLEQRMSGLSITEMGYPPNPVSAPAPSGKPKNPEDKLFGDLVDLSKFKPGPNNMNHARTGSM